MALVLDPTHHQCPKALNPIKLVSNVRKTMCLIYIRMYDCLSARIVMNKSTNMYIYLNNTREGTRGGKWVGCA